MAILRGEGIVLKTHALGDTSRIVVAFMRDERFNIYTHPERVSIT